MFPINNHNGQIIAFTGRALKTSDKAKYLNSPETPIFKKVKNGSAVSCHYPIN